MHRSNNLADVGEGEEMTTRSGGGVDGGLVGNVVEGGGVRGKRAKIQRGGGGEKGVPKETRGQQEGGTEGPALRGRKSTSYDEEGDDRSALVGQMNGPRRRKRCRPCSGRIYNCRQTTSSKGKKASGGGCRRRR